MLEFFVNGFLLILICHIISYKQRLTLQHVIGMCCIGLFCEVLHMFTQVVFNIISYASIVHITVIFITGDPNVLNPNTVVSGDLILGSYTLCDPSSSYNLCFV